MELEHDPPQRRLNDGLSRRLSDLAVDPDVDGVRTPLIGMEEGAHHHGMCEMGANKIVERTEIEIQNPDNVHNLAMHRGKMRAQESSSS